MLRTSCGKLLPSAHCFICFAVAPAQPPVEMGYWARWTLGLIQGCDIIFILNRYKMLSHQHKNHTFHPWAIPTSSYWLLKVDFLCNVAQRFNLLLWLIIIDRPLVWELLSQQSISLIPSLCLQFIASLWVLISLHAWPGGSVADTVWILAWLFSGWYFSVPAATSAGSGPFTKPFGKLA